MINLLGMLAFLITGFLIRSAPIILAGYLGTLKSMLVFPNNKFSNILYRIMYLSAILIPTILSCIDDPALNQFLVYYPNFYIGYIGSFIIRIALIAISIQICYSFRKLHFNINKKTEFIVDFLFSYLQTVMLVLLSEFESNFMISWAYFLFALISLEPVLKVKPISMIDNVIKVFAMFLYALRLTSLAYSSWIMSLASLVIIVVGLIHLMNETFYYKLANVLKFVYIYLCIQYACGLNSWLALMIIVGALGIKIDYLDYSKLDFTKGLGIMIIIGGINFFIDSSTCFALISSLLGKFSLFHP